MSLRPALGRRWRPLVLAAIAVLLVPSEPLRHASGDPLPPHAPDRVLVSYQPGASDHVIAALERQVGGSLEKRILSDKVRVLRVPEGSVRRAVERLSADISVRFAEPDYYLFPQRVPNDPDFGKQWALRNTGQHVNGVSGTPGADIDAARAWDVSTGSRDVVVGVIDDGVSPDHPELSANIWRNPGGVNGCPAGTHGYDVVQKRCTHGGSGHGLGVAAVLGAVGNNGSGGTGAAWSVSIMSLKMDVLFGSSVTSSTIEAIEWATNARQNHAVNVRVLNLSYGGGGHSTALREAIQEAGSAGIMFVTAAGNGTRDLDSQPFYSCSYGTWNMICVTSTDQNDTLVHNYGKKTVHLGAPGVNIYSLPGRGYTSGTSNAAPLVSAVAALIWSKDPGLEVGQVKGKILNNVDPLPSLQGKTISGGRLNAYNALTGSPPPSSTPVPAPTSTPSPAPPPTPTSSPRPTAPSSTSPPDDHRSSGDPSPGDDASEGGGSETGSGREGSASGGGGGTSPPDGHSPSGSASSSAAGADSAPGDDTDSGGQSGDNGGGRLSRILGSIPGSGLVRSLPGIGRLIGGGGERSEEAAVARNSSDTDGAGESGSVQGWLGVEETTGSSGGLLVAAGLGLVGFGSLIFVAWRQGALVWRSRGG